MSDLVLDAKLSKAVYNSYNQNNTPVIEGWKPVQLVEKYFKPLNADPQFGAQLYEKDGQFKVVYRGTQPGDWRRVAARNDRHHPLCWWCFEVHHGSESC